MKDYRKTLKLEKTHDFCPSGNPRLTVVFLHGIAADSSSFERTIRYLENTAALSDIRYVTFDLLGAGKSLKNDNLDYGYPDQIAALENSLAELNIATPLILVGHSMGTLIVTRYAYDHKTDVALLILCSPPIYTEKDLDNPAFEMAMTGFKNAVSVKNREILREKSFNQSLNKIVKNRKNYKRLASITTPAILIYGDLDQIIAPHNIPKAIKANPKFLSAIKTVGRHGMSREKNVEIGKILDEMLQGDF